MNKTTAITLLLGALLGALLMYVSTTTREVKLSSVRSTDLGPDAIRALKGDPGPRGKPGRAGPPGPEAEPLISPVGLDFQVDEQEYFSLLDAVTFLCGGLDSAFFSRAYAAMAERTQAIKEYNKKQREREKKRRKKDRKQGGPQIPRFVSQIPAPDPGMCSRGH